MHASPRTHRRGHRSPGHQAELLPCARDLFRLARLRSRARALVRASLPPRSLQHHPASRAPAPDRSHRPVGGMCECCRFSGGLDKYAGQALHLVVGAHDGGNGDGAISRPNKRAPTRRYGCSEGLGAGRSVARHSGCSARAWTVDRWRRGRRACRSTVAYGRVSVLGAQRHIDLVPGNGVQVIAMLGRARLRTRGQASRSSAGRSGGSGWRPATAFRPPP